MKPIQGRRQHILRWIMWLGVAISAVAVIIYLLIWYGPDLIARHDIGTVTGPLRFPRLQQARDAARGRLLTLGAGLFAAGALIFTGRNYQVARKSLEVSEQGQVTDRYTKAIEQLGSKRLDVRIGGIFALERIALDSARDHPTVMEVLAAFIREHSRKPWPKPTPENDAPERATRPDVQAALIVIGRRVATYDRQPIDLRGADLTRADLTHADLTSADFQYADLTSAIFRYADLRKACLRETNLTHASLQDVNLTGADLLDARLHSASFANVEFNGANLTMADFTGASLREANLTGAILGPTAVEPTDVPEADWVVVGLQYEFARRLETKFNDANLTDALFPLDAAVPDGWVRDPSSGRLRRTEKG